MQMIKCHICLSQNIIVVKKFKNPYSYTLMQCSECGLIFQNPLPSSRFLSKFYDQLYTQKKGLASTITAFEDFHESQEEERIHSIEKYVPKGKLLDIGASSGFFLHQLSKYSQWKGYGVEISESAVKEARRRFGIDILHGDISHPKIENSYFDVITMFSVFEHIPDLHFILKSVAKKLKAGGVFIFNVPNIRSFEYSFYQFLKKDFPGFIFEHVYYFTPKSLEKLLSQHKFEAKQMTSRHYSHLSVPSFRPLIGIPTFIAKLFLEYTDLGGSLKVGNTLTVYAQKIS